MGKMRFQRFGKCAVPVVSVEIIALEKIIGHIQIGPAVSVEIAGYHIESECNLAAVNTRLDTHVDKSLPIVAIQFVTASLMTAIAYVTHPETAHFARRIVDEVHIQVPVPVVIEKRRMDGKSRIVEAIGSSLFGKTGHAVVIRSLIDKEPVGPVVSGCTARTTDIDIRQTIPIYVGNAHAGRPAAPAFHTGPVRHLFEPERASVQIKSILQLIGGQHQVAQPVTVQIGDTHPAAVEIIAVREHIEGFCGPQPVLETDTGPGRRDQGKETISRRRLLRDGTPGKKASGDQNKKEKCGAYLSVDVLYHVRLLRKRAHKKCSHTMQKYNSRHVHCIVLKIRIASYSYTIAGTWDGQHGRLQAYCSFWCSKSPWFKRNLSLPQRAVAITRRPCGEWLRTLRTDCPSPEPMCCSRTAQGTQRALWRTRTAFT